MVSFKEIEKTDIDCVVNLMQEFYAIDNYPIEKETSKKLFEAFISNENLGKAWLILSDNEIVGYVILTFVFSFEYKGRIAFLDELYLSEKARGKGIGKKTIAFIKEEISKLAINLLYLEVEKHNQKAQKLYIASDFEFHNRKLMRFKPR